MLKREVARRSEPSEERFSIRRFLADESAFRQFP